MHMDDVVAALLQCLMQRFCAFEKLLLRRQGDDFAAQFLELLPVDAVGMGETGHVEVEFFLVHALVEGMEQRFHAAFPQCGHHLQYFDHVNPGSDGSAIG